MGFDFTLPGLGKPEGSRPKRVGEAIKNELSILLLQKVRDPGLREVTISSVEVTPDLKLAKVYYVVSKSGDAGKVSKGLARAKGFFRSHIAGQLNLRYTPDLVFYPDPYNEGIERLDELFRQIAEERKTDDDPV